MQKSQCEDERSSAEASASENVGIIDLGDVKIETKQYSPFGFRLDNAFEWDWGG